VLFAVSVVLAPPASAQDLTIELDEDPFICDGGTRPLGTVSGLNPGEPVIFTSPQAGGVFSNRTADDAGKVEMRWTCDAPKTWEVTVLALLSQRSTMFTLTGAVAPPPPDPPLGAAFDAKSAMTAAEMAIWKDFSPYNTVGIYIPVNEEWDNRADKEQVNLTPQWVAEIFADGWRILPIYVGRQAPARCAIGRFENVADDPAVARQQGLESAADAAQNAGRLGLNPGVPIYYDMEGYRPTCAEPVIAFLDAWTEGLHTAGYLSGVYGSRTSTMAHLSESFGKPDFDAPDAVWVSTNNREEVTLGLENPPDNLWTNSRIHQYRLSVTRTYGGVTREVDDNIVDAPVATFRPIITDTDGDGIGEPEPDNCDNISNPAQVDLDQDGDGDPCDIDIDGDGVLNDVDFAPYNKDVSAEPTPTPTPIPPTPTPAPATATPVPEPTAVPTEVPTAAPTAVPTVAPTQIPTALPTAIPTALPTPLPAFESATDELAAAAPLAEEPPPSAPAESTQSGTVTVINAAPAPTDDESPYLWMAIAVSGVAALGFALMAGLSYRRARQKSLTLR